MDDARFRRGKHPHDMDIRPAAEPDFDAMWHIFRPVIRSEDTYVSRPGHLARMRGCTHVMFRSLEDVDL
jgi:hypothetical protein